MIMTSTVKSAPKMAPMMLPMEGLGDLGDSGEPEGAEGLAVRLGSAGSTSPVDDVGFVEELRSGDDVDPDCPDDVNSECPDDVAGLPARDDDPITGISVVNAGPAGSEGDSLVLGFAAVVESGDDDRGGGSPRDGSAGGGSSSNLYLQINTSPTT